ncbi:MAG: hypothetical protein INR64_14960, partial [Caulobacteraceae bacterium]|nr:hypothetical protein [Caulobacter sp.]
MAEGSVIGGEGWGAAGGRAGALSTRARAAKLAALWRLDARAQVAAQAERWFLWAPVAMGLGAALYIALPREPTLWLALGVTAAGLAGAVAAQRWG